MWRRGSKSRKQYRKRYNARRKWKRRAGARGYIKSAIARYIDSRAETKVFKYTTALDPLANDRFYTCQPMGTIVRGVAQNERIGDHIRLVGMKLVFNFVPLSTIVATGIRFRMGFIKGARFGTGQSTFVAVSAGDEEAVFDKAAPRTGAEIMNTDQMAILQNRMKFYRPQYMQTQVDNNVPINGGTNNIYNTLVDSVQRFTMWFPGQHRLVKWRTATDQWAFTQSQPQPFFYAFAQNTYVHNTPLGTLNYTVHVYYKDA